MTEKQMIAFLRQEGWTKVEPAVGVVVWEDPRDTDECWQDLPDAFLIASRRKRERETRRLKAAGWIRCNEGGYHRKKDLAFGIEATTCHTKAKALATLGAP